MRHGAQYWWTMLVEHAPAADPTLAGMLARLLAGPAGPDALLIVTDALEEAAAEPVVFNQATRGTLRALAQVCRDEAPRRAGALHG